MKGLSSAPGIRVPLLALEFGSFVGRGDDLDAIGRTFAAGAPLITVVGPPGAGKTRLAVRFATQAYDRWPDGVHLCDLADARDVTDLCAEVASCLETAVDPGAIEREIERAIGHLLVLDNVDRLLPDAASILGRWVAARGARVLATSRGPLGVEREIVHELGPLPEAAELFVARARAILSQFGPTAIDRQIISKIAARLDHLPLAIELAAGRVSVLSPAALLARLDRPFDVLTLGHRARPARHADMHAAIAWSWDLLDAHQQQTLAMLSTLRDPFTLDEALATIGPAHAAEAPPVADIVRALRRRSLVQAAGGSPERFALLQLVRAFAAERLDELAGPTSTVELVLAPDATWFRFGAGSRTDISRLKAQSLLLDALCAHRERAPGKALSIEALVAAGWPGEQIPRSAAINRVRVALSSLRSRGLREAVVRRGSGYLISPHVRLVRGAQ